MLKLTDKISKFFTYKEVIASRTAERLCMDNSLPDELLPGVMFVARNIGDPVRNHFGKPVIVTSWYRCPALNAIISNNPNSQHKKGVAIDFIVRGVRNLEVAEYIRDNLEFDQLILEYNWIHCSSLANGNRKQVLNTTDGKNYKKGLT